MLHAHSGQIGRQRGLAAHLRGPGGGEIGRATVKRLDQLADARDALGRRHPLPRPFVEGLARGGDGAVHVDLVRLGDGRDDLLAIGRDDVDPAARMGFDPFAADEQAIGMTKCGRAHARDSIERPFRTIFMLLSSACALAVCGPVTDARSSRSSSISPAAKDNMITILPTHISQRTDRPNTAESSLARGVVTDSVMPGYAAAA